MEEYVKLGFYGADFSENTLRWQLSTIMWRTIRGYAFKNVGKPEKTGWGEDADIWLKEDSGDMTARTFNYCTVESKGGDSGVRICWEPSAGMSSVPCTNGIM